MEFREVAVERHASAANEQDALRDGRGYLFAGDPLSSVYRAAQSVNTLNPVIGCVGAPWR